MDFREMKAFGITPAMLLAEFGITFDFLSLDVEGINVPILRRLMQCNPSFKLVCVEHDGQYAECDSIMQGYLRIYDNKENAIYARQ
jgi:hypothetical protein